LEARNPKEDLFQRVEIRKMRPARARVMARIFRCNRISLVLGDGKCGHEYREFWVMCTMPGRSGVSEMGI
jgi:hypothetical protein